MRGFAGRSFLRRRPSPAMIVACLALIVSLGGTSVAAVSQLGRNSVGTLQLQNGAVTNPKLRNNAVTSAKVQNRSLLRSDFAPGQLPAGPTGPQGPTGPPGPTGAAGAAGPAGTIGAITVRSASVAVDNTTATNGQYTTRSVEALCSSGELSISGGTGWSDSNNDLELFTGRLTPVQNSTNQVIGWRGVGGNDSGQPSTFTVYALCYRTS
jgi:hypothetical protein